MMSLRCSKRRFGVVAVSFTAAALVGAPVHGQSYPAKPVRAVVPYAPGGGVDSIARLLARKFQEATSQPLVIDNKPGASEMIGMAAVVQSAADGYTIGFTGAPLLLNPLLFKKVVYSGTTDLVPVGKLVDVPLVLVVNKDVPAQSLAELVAYAKPRAGKLNYGHLGAGSIHYLGMEWLKKLAGIDVAAVAYKGVAPSSAALLAGEVQMAFMGVATAQPHLKSGAFKAIAVNSAARSPALPDVPTVAESGYKDYVVPGWYGVVAPRGTPPQALQKLSSEFARILRSEDVHKQLSEAGLVIAPTTPEELAAQLRDEARVWEKIVNLVGVKPE